MLKIKVEIKENIADILNSIICMHFDFSKGGKESVFFNASLLRANNVLQNYLNRIKQAKFRTRESKRKIDSSITLSIDELCAIYQFIQLKNLDDESFELRLFYGVLNKHIVDLDVNNVYSSKHNYK